nr:PepSY domain-containing protein [Methanomicrobium sp. W14]
MEETGFGNFYHFSTGDGGGYYVDNETFAVVRAVFSSERSSLSGLNITIEEAEKKARDFLKENASFCLDRSLETTDAKLLDHGSYKEYSFLFAAEEDGVILFKRASVSVSPSTGDILNYVSVCRDTEVSLVPKISEGEALEIAEKQFDGIVVNSSSAQLMVDYPEKDSQKLVWQVEITGKPKDYTLTGGIVSIDAQTGEVYMKSSYL